MPVALKFHLLTNYYKSLILRDSLLRCCVSKFDSCKKPKTWVNPVQMLVALIHLLDKSLIWCKCLASDLQVSCKCLASVLQASCKCLAAVLQVLY